MKTQPTKVQFALPPGIAADVAALLERQGWSKGADMHRVIYLMGLTQYQTLAKQKPDPSEDQA